MKTAKSRLLFVFALFALVAFVGLSVGAAAAASAASKAATAATKHINAEYLSLPFADASDEARVKRGLIVKGDGKVFKDDGSVVWDISRYNYITGDITKPGNFPDTVNPSLWRQAILNTEHGLFEVTSKDFSAAKDGTDVRYIHQVRGYDISNMTFVETKDGFIVVDVTSYKESAAAAVKLFYDNLPAAKQAKKIHTIIYTHSHIDHYGGVLGVLNSAMVDNPDTVTIVAPEGFMEAAVSENVTAGAAMSQRARSMYGAALWSPQLGIPQGRGQVNNGLAIGLGNGTSGLMPPNTIINADNTTKVFDDINVTFLMAAHTEAPAEMVMLFEEYNSLCLAEICNQTQHNILTPRGAEVRDTIAWSDALDSMKKWVDGNPAVDSAWGPHTWPRWGNAEIADYIGKQSRLYRYIHDQTVFLMNKGYDMTEIAEVFTLPPDLAKEWFNRGYYGALSFNVKAVYQKYLGWFDSNAATLWKLPDKMSASFYAKYLPKSGGDLVKAAKLAYDDGEYRWTVEVLEKVRLASSDWFPGGGAGYNNALSLQADAFEQMGYTAESGIWRNYFLTAAWRNRDGTLAAALAAPGAVSFGADTVTNMGAKEILDTLSTQINAFTNASNFKGTILWDIDGEKYVMNMEDHVLWTKAALVASPADATITLTRADLNKALVSSPSYWLEELLKDANISIDDNKGLLTSLAALTRIAPPSLPGVSGGAPVDPGSTEQSKALLSWSNGGVFDVGSENSDSVIVAAVPSGRTVSGITITNIGGESKAISGATEWNGLRFSVDVPGAVKVSGSPIKSGIFTLSLEVTVDSGSRTEKLTGIVEFLIRPASGIDAETFVESEPSRWTLAATRNSDGSYAVTVSVPATAGIPKDGDDVYVRLAALSNVAFKFENDILYVTCVAQSRAALEALSLSYVGCVGADGRLYEQTLNPAVTWKNIGTKKVDGEGNSGGCNAGFSATVLITVLAAIATRKKKQNPR
ncbi:hypothetical protein AGMMS50276_02720 [Synergistales bacterium]|nr:hypothetical protein AGMMS50276_02720 [Synergistales bacterium]